MQSQFALANEDGITDNDIEYQVWVDLFLCYFFVCFVFAVDHYHVVGLEIKVNVVMTNYTFHGA